MAAGQDDLVTTPVTDAPPRQIDTVIFDLGGVLMTNGRHSDFVRRYPPEHADVALRLFMGEFGTDGDHPWHRLERGEITFAECQALNREAFAAAGIPTPTRPADTAATSAPGETASQPRPLMTFSPNDAMFALVRQLRAAGLRTGMLTNNIAEFRDAWRGLMSYDELFDDIVDSHEVGMRKPNPAIYELALTRLSARAGRTAFLDDLPANVEAAARLGMHAIVVDEDSAPAIATVERLAGLT